MDSSDEDDAPIRYRGKEKAQQLAKPAARTLNEALALALQNGFPGDTQCDIFVSAEELKREEEETKAKEGKEETATGGGSSLMSDGKSEMKVAEEKTRETLSQIRGESKVATEQRAISKDDRDDIDSDDEEEYFMAASSLKDLKSQDSLGTQTHNFTP